MSWFVCTDEEKNPLGIPAATVAEARTRAADAWPYIWRRPVAGLRVKRATVAALRAEHIPVVPEMMFEDLAAHRAGGKAWHCHLKGTDERLIVEAATYNDAKRLARLQWCIAGHTAEREDVAARPMPAKLLRRKGVVRASQESALMDAAVRAGIKLV